MIEIFVLLAFAAGWLARGKMAQRDRENILVRKHRNPFTPKM